MLNDRHSQNDLNECVCACVRACVRTCVFLTDTWVSLRSMIVALAGRSRSDFFVISSLISYIKIIHDECEGAVEKCVPRNTVRHHEAWQRDRYFSILPISE